MRDKVFPDPWPPERGDEPTVPYYRAALDQLLHELTNREENQYAETWWWDERTVSFLGRRMAHEAAIHRADVEQAHADVTPLDAELALDGVDEVLRRFLVGDWSDQPASERPGDIVQIRCGGTTWRVVMEPNAIAADVFLDRWPELPAAALVSGEPPSMYLWLWGRGSRDSLIVDGDAAAVDHLRARLVTATQ